MRPFTPTGNKPAAARDAKAKVWLHRAVSVLLAAAWAWMLAANCLTFNLPGKPGWLEALLLLLATIGTVTALTRQLPLQNVLLAAGIISLLGGAAQALGAATGIPFGPFLFGGEAGSRLFKTLPWPIPLIWVVVILNSRGVARLILRPWRKTRSYGLWLIGLTALLTGSFGFALDPFATRVKHYWLWLPTKFPVSWQGAPLVNFLSWGAVALLILAFVTPALINKNPTRISPDYHPLAVWLGAVLWFGTACAQHGIWPAVVLDGTVAVVVAAFAIRGARW
ncbi:MAG TPA: carotenoid biosynthesis protein [Candidatus Acidoferrum sp.]|nr:carotenoid biosynthesis protein [Candidatus Acidoferrum sp.]